MLLAGDIGATKNDREAIAYGLPLLEPDDLHTLNEGSQIKRTLNRLLLNVERHVLRTICSITPLTAVIMLCLYPQITQCRCL
jgi:hypothetical protein